MASQDVRSQTQWVPWYHRAGPWIGISTNPGVVVLGGGLAARVRGSTLVATLLVGMAAVTALAVAQGVIARRRRQALVAYAADVFGEGFGATLFGAIITLGMVGWFSFYVSLAGASLSALLHAPGWVGPTMLAGVFVAISAMGISRWNALAWLTALFTLLTALIVVMATGARPVWQDEPFRPGTFSTGVATLVGYAIVFATRAGDFTWDLRWDRDVVWAGLSLLLPAWLFLTVGVVLYLSAGHWNLADLLAQTRSAAFAHVFLILAVVAPALSALYSVVLASGRLIRVAPTARTVTVGAIAALLGALRFDTRLLTFLDVLAALIPPALALMLLVGFLPRWLPARREWLAWAWLAGALAGVILKLRQHPAYMFLAMGISVILAAVPRVGLRSLMSGITPSDERRRPS